MELWPSEITSHRYPLRQHRCLGKKKNILRYIVCLAVPTAGRGSGIRARNAFLRSMILPPSFPTSLGDASACRETEPDAQGSRRATSPQAQVLHARRATIAVRVLDRTEGENIRPAARARLKLGRHKCTRADVQLASASPNTSKNQGVRPFAAPNPSVIHSKVTSTRPVQLHAIRVEKRLQ